MVLRVNFPLFLASTHNFDDCQFLFLLVFITTCLFLYFFISTIVVTDVGSKTLSRSTERGMAYANFKAHKFSYLNITNIGSDYVLESSECGFACVNIPSCFSFNLAAFSDILNGKILCELLPSDIYNNSNKFVANQFHHHYSIAVSEKLSLKKYKLNLFICLFLSCFTVLL